MYTGITKISVIYRYLTSNRYLLKIFRIQVYSCQQNYFGIQSLLLIINERLWYISATRLAITICHALEISYACSVCVNNLVVNTSVDKFPMKRILEKVHIALCNIRCVNALCERNVREQLKSNSVGSRVISLPGKANSEQACFKMCQHVT